ncbi:hypothetical protein BaRGS_00021824 [Batillaria attramentaria]|uniref:Uncharacterized protein n=1 Tax=Batillaria attramentaria TaxID=370345 RepID=A0ABD0KID9_9CAEN
MPKTADSNSERSYVASPLPPPHAPCPGEKPNKVVTSRSAPDVIMGPRFESLLGDLPISASGRIVDSPIRTFRGLINYNSYVLISLGRINLFTDELC